MSIVIAAVIVAFSAGLVVGVTWRESVELLLGRDDPQMMLNRTKSTARAVLGHRTTVATWAVVLAILVGTILGIVVAFTHSDATEAKSGERALVAQLQATVSCQQQFNHRVALARRDRNHAGAHALKHTISIADADIDVWLGIRHLLTTPNGTLHDALVVIDRRVRKGRGYLASLQNQQHVQKLHRFPPADYCSPEGRGPR